MGSRGRQQQSYLGKQYGNLTVMEELSTTIGTTGKLHRKFICKCICGKHTTAFLTDLTSKRKVTCANCTHGGRTREQIMSNDILRNYRNGAKRREIEFSITDTEFLSILTQPCFYCGKFRCRRNIHTKEEFYNFNGVDRVNSVLGYISGNVVPCCTFCNQAKNSRGTEEFLGWIRDTYLFQLEKPEKMP